MSESLVLNDRSVADTLILAEHRVGKRVTLRSDFEPAVPAAISDNGLIAGAATLLNGAQHAVIWFGQHRLDVAGAGLGGPNSAAFGISDRGQVDGQAETGTVDPNKENFCDYGTGFTCVPFVWRHGILAQLPTLGGNNATVGNINVRGVVSGLAETAIVDPSCPGTVAANGDGPRTLHYEAVLWGPKLGEVRELHPLPGDSVGEALWVNDKGQAVGTSGTCAITLLPPFITGPHAVLWEKDGSIVDLGNLGGTLNTAALIGNWLLPSATVARLQVPRPWLAAQNNTPLSGPKQQVCAIELSHDLRLDPSALAHLLRGQSAPHRPALGSGRFTNGHSAI